MKRLRRFARSVLAMWEAAKQRQDVTRIVTSFRDSWRDYSKSTRQILQEKARYWICNSALLSRLADIFEGGTVGTGLIVNPDSSDKDWNKASRSSFTTWSKFADISSRQTFGTLQSLVARSWFIDGECFVIKTRGVDRGGVTRPRLQLLEAHRISTPQDRIKDEGISIIDGIEIDPKTLRPTAYWRSTSDNKGKVIWEPIDSRDVIHVFEPQRPGEYRGVPFCAGCLNTLEDMERLERLEMKAATAAAVVANVITNEAGELDPADILASGGSVSGEAGGAVSAVKEFTGGETVVLRNGDKMEQFASDRPSVVTVDYWRYLKGKVCMGTGIPLCIADPESMQGTVFRGALAVYDRWIKARSAVMQAFVEEVYIWVTSENRLIEKEIADRPGDWVRTKIYPPKSYSVDIGYDTSAVVEQLDAGITTYDQVYGEKGLYWEEQFEALSAQRERGRELGILPGAPAPQPAPATVPASASAPA